MENKEEKIIKMMPLSFYKAGGVFTGGDKSVRYLVRKEGEDEKLSAYVWPGPFRFNVTDDELKKSSSFSLSEEGINEAAAWLEKTYKDMD